MENLNKIHLIIFILLLLFAALFFATFLHAYDFFSASILSLLSWSFYILLIPASHGKFIIGVPYQIITGRKMKYPEVPIWIGALLFNATCIFSIQRIYMETIGTHFLLSALSSPWPYWFVIFVSASGTFYKRIVGYEKFYKNKIFHYMIRTILVTVGIINFIYYSYGEMIILLNVHT